MSNVSEMTVEELERVLAEKKQQKADAERLRREAYVKLRTDLLNRICLLYTSDAADEMRAV